jgi:hypothetical protein
MLDRKLEGASGTACALFVIPRRAYRLTMPYTIWRCLVFVSERIHIALRIYTAVNYDVRLILRKEGADELVETRGDAQNCISNP